MVCRAASGKAPVLAEFLISVLGSFGGVLGPCGKWVGYGESAHGRPVSLESKDFEEDLMESLVCIRYSNTRTGDGSLSFPPFAGRLNQGVFPCFDGEFQEVGQWWWEGFVEELIYPLIVEVGFEVAVEVFEPFEGVEGGCVLGVFFAGLPAVGEENYVQDDIVKVGVVVVSVAEPVALVEVKFDVAVNPPAVEGENGVAEVGPLLEIPAPGVKYLQSGPTAGDEPSLAKGLSGPDTLNLLFPEKDRTVEAGEFLDLGVRAHWSPPLLFSFAGK